MKRNLHYRLIFILLVLVVCIVLSYPPSEKINLGLDLKGGIHLVLQVKTEDAFEVETSQRLEMIEADLKEEKIVYTRAQVTEDFGINIIGALQEQEDQLEVYLNQYSPAWTYRSRYREGELDMEMVMSSAEKRRWLTVRYVMPRKPSRSVWISMGGRADDSDLRKWGRPGSDHC